MRNSESLKGAVVALALGCGLVFALCARAQTDPAPVRLLSPQEVPPHGTFWFLGRTNSPPLPYNPYPQLSVYSLPNGSFLVDDLDLDPATLRLEAALDRALRTVEAEYGIASPAASPTASARMQPLDLHDPEGEPPPAYTGYPSNSLWLELISVTNAMANVRLHGTVEAVTYELLSKQDLLEAGWSTEGAVSGAAGQDWTPAAVAVGTRSNLFLWARSVVDEDGIGLPDWWEQQYFGTNGIDPYLDLAGDGWTVVYKYERGLNPRQFLTPPAPTGLAVRYAGNGNPVRLSWNPCTGPVTGYTVQRDVPECASTVTFEVAPASTSTLLDTSYPLSSPNLVNSSPAAYRIKAHYHGADSAWSDFVPLYASDAPPYRRTGQTNSSAALIRGPAGAPLLAVSALPQNTANVRLLIQLTINRQLVQSNVWYFPSSSFSNGICALPSGLPVIWVNHYVRSNALDSRCICGWFVQPLDAMSNVLESMSANARFLEADTFWDGREQLKQNLSFFLRASYTDEPFSFTLLDAPAGGGATNFSYCPNTNYIAVSYNTFEDVCESDVPVTHLAHCDPYLPFRLNYLCRNFVFSAANIDTNGSFTTGADCLEAPDASFFPAALLYPPTYFFQTNSLAAVLNPPSVHWTWNRISYYNWPEFFYYLIGLGISGDYSTVTLDPQARNLFGLPILSVRYRVYRPETHDFSWNILYPGDSTTEFIDPPYAETQEPNLATYGYYFGRPNNGPGDVFPTLDPLPGQEPFSAATATNALFIQAWNQPVRFAGYAKQVILNGDHTKYVYLGQYFDKAYRLNEDGNWTETGLLSEYGDFLPTEPGLTVLRTKPDLTQADNRQGECTIHVIKLQLDVNHDNTMDWSFGGPDNTSSFRPFTFWVNNDFDRWHDFYEPDWNQVHDQEEDDLKTAGSPGTVGVTPDCDYQWADGAYAIPSKRDLEDYTRLWLPGIKKLYETHTNLSFELSIRNNDTADGPAINLVLAVESDGGTRYLTNTSVANDQISLPSGKCIGRISPHNTIRLNDFFELALYPGTGAEHFIWCGAKRGKGELVLQVKDGSNLLAETSAWLDLKDIKEMYERWTVGDNGSKPPTNTAYCAVEDLPMGISKFQYTSPSDTNTPYILHVHGWNMSRYDKDRYAETAFKRLYLQGYQGRFGSFRWPTKTGFTTFDSSEFNAWKSGEGLYRVLTNLNATYPGRVYLTAHSMGNIVAAEALRKAGTGQLVNTYIAMQAAIVSHAYDPTTTNRSLGILDSFTYDRHAEYWTNGAPCYLNGVQGAGHFANFFNRRDWALSWWETDQDTKLDFGYSWVAVPNENERYYYTDAFNNVRALHFPQDTYEVFSFITEARCYAVGAQTNVAGPFTLSAQVNLDIAPHSFGELHKGHSGEFRSTNMERWPFWERVLFTMGLKAAQ